MRQSEPTSSRFLSQKQQVLGDVAQAFGVTLTAAGTLPTSLLPTPGQYKKFHARVNDKYLNKRELFLADLPAPRSQLQRAYTCIFRPAGLSDACTTLPPNPQVMDVVSAVLDQYFHCYWLDMQAKREYESHSASGRDTTLREQNLAVEAMRAQVAPYYAHVLVEHGLSPEHAVRVVGNAIYGFTETINRANTGMDAAVHPQRGNAKEPDALISHITRYAELTPEGHNLRRGALGL